VTYYPVSGTYAADWSEAHSTTDLTASLEFGLPSFGSGVGEFDNKAYHATPGFSIARASLSRQQDLPYGAQAWGSVTGQLTNDSLVSSEQIAAGGAESVRGYLEAETLGDMGAYLQTELRSPSLAKYLGGPLHSLKFHLFYDAGVVNLNNPTPNAQGSIIGIPSTYGLQSAGIGARLNMWGYLNGVLQDAETFNRGPDTKPGTNRVLFRVYGEF
jgi:hemolysin activation/secretion protein